MLGVIVNFLSVVLGGTLGHVFRLFLPKKFEKAVMTALALCVMFIGVKGMFSGQKTLVIILSMVFGAIIGALVDPDKQLARLGDFIRARLMRRTGNGKSAFSEVFVYSTLFFCVGAMAITGGMDAGLKGDNTTYYTKAVLDGISSLFLASSLGLGVVFAAVPLFVYQSAIVLFANLLRPVLSEAVIAEMGVVGSILLVGLALNLLGLTKIKVMNLVPAVFLPILFCLFL